MGGWHNRSPLARTSLLPLDRSGRPWLSLQRYASWHRDNSLLSGLSKRERDIFFLQFCWLTPMGQGAALLELIQRVQLAGRWMRDIHRTHQQYLGEMTWSPVARGMLVD